MTISSIPEGLDLISTSFGQVVRKVWRSWRVIPMILFALTWDSFLVFYYLQILKPGAPLVMALFPLLHVVIGVGITYHVIASIFNKTDIQISESGLKVVSGPIPWIGNKEVRADEIRDVMVRERSWNRNQIVYHVMYVDQALKERKLVSVLTQKEQADFVVRIVRDTLRLSSGNVQ